MTRKDFELIAEAIRFTDAPRDMRQKFADSFADSLRHANARFDTDRFIAAAMKPTGADIHAGNVNA